MKTMQDWEIISLDTTTLRELGTDKCPFPFVTLQLS